MTPPDPLIVTCTECGTQYDAEDAPCPSCGSSSQTVDRYELADWHVRQDDRENFEAMLP